MAHFPCLCNNTPDIPLLLHKPMNRIGGKMSTNKYYGGRALRIAVGITVLVLLLSGGVEAATLVVCPGGCAFSSIQAAINASSNGDAIQVQSGTYYENVNVNKQLTLRGIGNPVVSVATWESAITLSEDRITLEGFNAESVMNEDSVMNVYVGIRVNSNNNTLINNNANTNSGGMRTSYGIYLDSSNNNTLIGNNAFGLQTYGIYLNSSNNNTLIDNNASNNQDPWVGTGVFLISSNNNTLIGNNASNNEGEVGIGIYLISSNNNSLISNNANSNVGGFGSSYGIILSSSSNNTLISNNANSNIGSVYSYGIYLGSSNNNKIYHNNLMQNTDQAYDNSNNNFWDNGYPSGGNYWGDYTGVDLNGGPGQNIPGSDGIGDTPYPISGGLSVDRYPLMKLWEITSPRFINGTVMDSVNKTGISGVTVSANTTLNTITNATGFYSLAVTAGSYNLMAKFQPRYYANNSIMVSTELRDVVKQDIELLKKQTGNISGRVSAFGHI